MNPHTIPIEKIPRKIPQTNPTPPDESDTTGQVFFQIRMNPTPPDHSDRLQPPHNPSVVVSIPTGPTKRVGDCCSRLSARTRTLHHLRYSAIIMQRCWQGGSGTLGVFCRRGTGE